MPPGAAGPAEADFFEAGGFDFRHVGGGDFGAVAAGVFGNEGEQGAALGVGEVGGKDADGIEGGGLAVFETEDFGGGFFAEDDVGFSCGEKRGGEGAGDVLLGGEDAQALFRALADFAGIGAHERGRHGNAFARDEGDVDRKVVALEAPAPALRVAGSAENGDVIFGGVALERVVFDFGEDTFQAHDLVGLEFALFAQGGVDERDGRLALGVGHFLERKSGAVAGRVAEILALVAGEGEGCLGFLGRVERGEELVGGQLAHGGGVQFASQHGEGEKQAGQKIFHREDKQSGTRWTGKARLFKEWRGRNLCLA